MSAQDTNADRVVSSKIVVVIDADDPSKIISVHNAGRKKGLGCFGLINGDVCISQQQTISEQTSDATNAAK